MGEPGGLTLDHTNAGAAVATGRDLLDPPVVEPDGRAALVLGVDLGEFGPGPQRRTEGPFDHVLVDHRLQPTSSFPSDGGSRFRTASSRRANDICR